MNPRPVLVALLLFLAFAVAFSPDAAVGEGVFWHHDLRHHHFAWRAWAAEVWASGEVPWWAPGAGNGFPLLAEGEGGLLYVPTMLLFVLLPDGLALNEYKTKRALEMLNALGVAGKSVLFVTAAPQPQLERSVGNLPGVDVIRAEGLNVYDVLRHERLVIAKEAVAALAQRLGQAGVEA